MASHEETERALRQYSNRVEKGDARVNMLARSDFLETQTLGGLDSHRNPSCVINDKSMYRHGPSAQNESLQVHNLITAKKSSLEPSIADESNMNLLRLKFANTPAAQIIEEEEVDQLQQAKDNLEFQTS